MTTHSNFFEALASQTEMGWTPQQARAALVAAVYGKARTSSVIRLPVRPRRQSTSMPKRAVG
jgi:hypothetical protein